MHVFRLIDWAGLSLLLVLPLQGQRQPTHLARGFEAGLAVDALFAPGFADFRVSALSLLLGGLNPGRTGFEATVTVGPLDRLDEDGHFVLMDLDATHGVDIDGPILLLRGGAGFIGAVGGAPTVNAGMALVLPVADRFGLRFDGTVRFLALGFPHLYFVTIGIGTLLLPGPPEHNT